MKMSSKKAPNLPGYYYDEKTNRYYKLQPGQHNLNPLTGESFKTKPCKLKKIGNNRMPKKKKKNHIEKKHLMTNICNLITRKRTESSSSSLYERCVLQGLIKVNFNQNKVVHFENHWLDTGGDNVTLKEFIPSRDFSKLVFQCDYVGKQAVSLINSIDKNNKTVTHELLPIDCGFSICGFCHTLQNKGILMSCLFRYNVCKLIYVPNTDLPVVLRKNVTGMPLACAWQENPVMQQRFSYSIGSTALIVSDINRHFLVNSAQSQKIRLESDIVSLEFSSIHDSLFTGTRSGVIAMTDCRSSSVSSRFSTDSCGKNASCIRSMKNQYYVISRHFSTEDSIHLWDIRNTTKPILTYVSIDINQTSQSSTSLKRLFNVDTDDRILSCTNADNIMRLWDVKSGKELFHCPGSVMSGIYSDIWPLHGNDPGLLGIQQHCISWLPLSGHKLS